MMNDPQDNRATLDSKYSLVIAVAKRAREIVNRREQSPAHKPVTVALDEIRRGKILVTIRRQEETAVEETHETPEAQDSTESPETEPSL